MKTRSTCLLFIICSILQIVGVAIFAKGFFPYKTVLSGNAKHNEAADYEEFGLQPLSPPEPLFDRLVFVVIDALRRYTPLRQFNVAT
jgi:ethanolamine phosphate transferase 2 subunit G